MTRTAPTLTPRQHIERLIANDARNVRDMLSSPALTYGQRTRVIADCAKRLFEARAIDRELEREAEGNLRTALEGWQG